jgi:hypothetical protein
MLRLWHHPKFFRLGGGIEHFAHFPRCGVSILGATDEKFRRENLAHAISRSKRLGADAQAWNELPR